MSKKVKPGDKIVLTGWRGETNGHFYQEGHRFPCETIIKRSNDGVLLVLDVWGIDWFTFYQTAKLPIHITLSTPDFTAFCVAMGLKARQCDGYSDAALYSPSGELAAVVVCRETVNKEFNDEGIEYLVKTYESIKINPE